MPLRFAIRTAHTAKRYAQRQASDSSSIKPIGQAYFGYPAHQTCCANFWDIDLNRIWNFVDKLHS
jgi:hypothetical protein